MSLFCKHKWNVVCESTTKSKIEVASEAIKVLPITASLKLPWQLCSAERKHITIVACEKCGKLKRYVEKI